VLPQVDHVGVTERLCIADDAELVHATIIQYVKCGVEHLFIAHMRKMNGVILPRFEYILWYDVIYQGHCGKQVKV
jgi:hypothetical protein